MDCYVKVCFSSKVGLAGTDHIVVAVFPCFPFDQAFCRLLRQLTAIVSSCNSFPEISAGACPTLSYGARH